MIAQVDEINNQKVAVPISGAIPTGLPVGTWISFEKDQAPDNKWIKEGETFDENLYPALYLFLGTNKVPERFDMNRLDPLTVVQLTANVGYTCLYDGFAVICGSRNNPLNCKLNGQNIVTSGGGGSDTWQVTVPFHKGDILLTNKTTEASWNVEVSYNTVLISYARHPMFIKATSAIEITDQNTFLNTVQSLVQTANSYSTEETATGGFWIDGKPIYRKTYEIGATNSLGNNTAKTIASGLTNIDRVIEIKPRNVFKGTNNYWYAERGITFELRPNGDFVVVNHTGSNIGWLSWFVSLEYTKI